MSSVNVMSKLVITYHKCINVSSIYLGMITCLQASMDVDCVQKICGVRPVYMWPFLPWIWIAGFVCAKTYSVFRPTVDARLPFVASQTSQAISADVCFFYFPNKNLSSPPILSLLTVTACRILPSCRHGKTRLTRRLTSSRDVSTGWECQTREMNGRRHSVDIRRTHAGIQWNPMQDTWRYKVHLHVQL